MSSPKEVLKKYFGYDDFRSKQHEIVETIISGKNVLAILPTGAGKSVCYQIPALVSDRFSIVISPLIALMKNQIDELHKLNIPAESIHSGTDINSYYSLKQKLINNELKLLYVSPERLTNIYFIEMIQECKPEYLFVDEAHCISEWGHSFRPSYRKIADFCTSLKILKVSAFTASAIPEVAKDIVKQLRFVEPKIFISGFERENLSVKVEITNDKKSRLLKILNANSAEGSSIIYSSTRKTSEEISAFLNLNKIPAAFYHAGMPQQRRQTVQEDFINDKVKVISATNAFGMGINKPDIRNVIHYNMPATIESYYQEIGRAGRDGNSANAFLLYEKNDYRIQERLIHSTFPFQDEIITIYNLLYNYAKIALGAKTEKPLRLNSDFYEILKSKKISEQKFNSALDYFEQLNLIYRQRKSYLKYLSKINIDKKNFRSYIKDSASFEFRELLIYLARLYGSAIFDTLTELNIENMASFFETPINKIRNKLSQLSDYGVVDFEAPNTSIVLIFSAARFDPEKSDYFYRHANRQLAIAMNKLSKMQEFVIDKNCRFDFILRYFGQIEDNYRCKKCDNCSNRNDSQESIEYISEMIIDTLNDLRTPIEKSELIDALAGEENRIDLWNIKNFSALKFYQKKLIEESIEILKVRGIITERKSQIKIKNIKPVAEEQNDFDSRLILFGKLKDIRHNAANKYFQTDQLICSDDILLEIVERMPKTYSELMSTNGFNQRMFNKIGDEFIKAIKEFISSNDKKPNIPPELEKTFDLIKRNHSLQKISELLKLSDSIVSVQVETILKFYPDIKITSLVSRKHFEMIRDAIDKGHVSIKDIREFLGESISYAEIRIVKAKLRIN